MVVMMDVDCWRHEYRMQRKLLQASWESYLQAFLYGTLEMMEGKPEVHRVAGRGWPWEKMGKLESRSGGEGMF